MANWIDNMRAAASIVRPFLRAPARAALAMLVALLTNQGFSAACFAQTTAPLLQQSDITYVGAFALPQGRFGTSDFTYGGGGLAVYRDAVTGQATLFMEGHGPGQVAQVAIPSNFVVTSNWSDLPQAKVLQNFSDITNGTLSQIDPGNATGNYIYGMLPFNGRLIIGASNTYSATQTKSFGVLSSLTFSGATFNGWYTMNSTAPPRAVGGSMIEIPSAWQPLFGGTAFAGEFGESIVSTTSFGPTLTLFNPDAVGTNSALTGTTLLFYPEANPVCGSFGCEHTRNTTFNLAIEYAGMAFPANTRSILFVTMQGTGPYCYGYGVADSSQGSVFSADGTMIKKVFGPDGVTVSCYDPTFQGDKGPHAYPYRDQILAYDANDILAVKNGSKNTWDPKPYAIFTLPEMDPVWGIKGATYDQLSGNLYITSAYGTNPRVNVYHITAPNPAPNPPASIAVR